MRARLKEVGLEGAVELWSCGAGRGAGRELGECPITSHYHFSLLSIIVS